MQKAIQWDRHFLHKRPTTGLEVDGLIFEQIFKPYRTTIQRRQYVDIQKRNGGIIRLHMEHIGNRLKNDGNENWFMINQELPYSTDVKLLPSMDVVICKTRFAYKLVAQYLLHMWTKKEYSKSKTVIYLLGFTSIIRPVSGHYELNYNKALHLAGASWMKGTDSVLKAWARHPEWPEITILCRDMCWDDIKSYVERLRQKGAWGKNMTLYTHLVDSDKVQELLETCGIQLVTSDSEGWGHYIQEARAHSALCLYTDYPPMNEFFDEQSGIAVTGGHKIKMDGKLPGADGFRISAEAIEHAMSRVLNMSLTERKRMGKQARISFYKERVKFLKAAEVLKKRIK